MTRHQLENIYKRNGLIDYKLRNTDDLLRVHGIDFTEVAGYKTLDDINRAIYEEFIVNFFNAFGLDNRLKLIPKGIFWVEHKEYLVKEDPQNDYYDLACQIIYSIDREGTKNVLHQWEDDNYKHLMRKEIESQFFLRFEYQQGFNDQDEPWEEWLHVIKGGKEWY